MDSVDPFAAEAWRFREWALNGSDQAEWAARGALIRLTNLYAAALELPPAWNEELADQPIAKSVGEDECLEVTVACRRLPFDLYGEVFNTLPVPPEQPVVGSLTDDITDIYRDVITGLREYESGRRAQAVWEWGSGLRQHWGGHATGAIRALHCWLASNAVERLAAEAQPVAATDGRGG